MTLIPLMPLRIPAGFAVCYNGFHYVDPVESDDNDGFLDNWGLFTEDILQIAKMDIKKGDWNIPKEHLLIDLGWYPDGRIDGRYKLILAVVREDHSWDTIKEKESKDRFEIRDTIEQWMQEHIKLKKY